MPGMGSCVDLTSVNGHIAMRTHETLLVAAGKRLHMYCRSSMLEMEAYMRN